MFVAKRLRTIILLFFLNIFFSTCFSQQTPPMGWNSWNEFGVNVSEDLIKEVCDAMKRYNLDDCGYKYIVIDDGWQAKELGDNGHLDASPEKFPSGIKPLSNYLNCKGDVLSILTNKEVIALNQDKLCKQANKVSDETHMFRETQPIRLRRRAQRS